MNEYNYTCTDINRFQMIMWHVGFHKNFCPVKSCICNLRMRMNKCIGHPQQSRRFKPCLVWMTNTSAPNHEIRPTDHAATKSCMPLHEVRKVVHGVLEDKHPRFLAEARCLSLSGWSSFTFKLPCFFKRIMLTQHMPYAIYWPYSFAIFHDWICKDMLEPPKTFHFHKGLATS